MACKTKSVCLLTHVALRVTGRVKHGAGDGAGGRGGSRSMGGVEWNGIGVHRAPCRGATLPI